MADWTLEKVEGSEGKVWTLTLANERDVFVFANAPRLFDAARFMMDAADKRDNEGIRKAVGMLTVAVLLASGDAPVEDNEEVVH
jgi:hypothetical protein